ncbi:hypothetical protein [Mycolicibacterium obuense]|uniref:hypothetical protein n=1 Tax=Mycolicibacterium obuense TaxID=1807 RepID=UPI000A7C4692|nr:hypothetical protein [Mycolicibacterium obuense]
MTSCLLLCIAAVIVLVAVVCAAVRFCDLEHVDLAASLGKLGNFTLKVKRRPSP